MLTSLRVAASSSPRLVLGAGAIVTAAAIAAGVATTATATPAVEPVSVQATTPAEPIAEPIAAVASEPAPPAAPVRSRQLLFAFTASKATFVRLADLQSPRDDEPSDPADPPRRHVDKLAVPRHARLRLVTDDGVQSAIGAVAPRDVPAAYAAWLGKAVRVDHACEAHVVGFAVIAQVTGDASYVGDGSEAWTVKNVFAAGQPMLAAQLDGCTGGIARDAALPDIVALEVSHDAALERAARRRLLGSQAARDMQVAWDADGESMNATPSAWTKDAELTSQVVRHPRTGERFVSVQARVAGGCGAPEANVWGLYRVVDGKLVVVHERRLAELETIDALLDLEGDGELEVLGKPWLGTDRILMRASGEVLDEIALAFAGCPC
ncbi:MAG TPA: hypothetical protein VFP84_31765 [Kofleriaceae bacterium]|nr:hypothetical protein [Kofleriaceae bacterium]